MPELTEPPELALGEFELSVAQLAEVWGAESDDEGVALLARIAQLPEFADESRSAPPPRRAPRPARHHAPAHP